MDKNDYTRFEKARLIGSRAIQISMGATPKVAIEDSIDPIDIAKKEFEEDKLPLDVIREE